MDQYACPFSRVGHKLPLHSTLTNKQCVDPQHDAIGIHPRSKKQVGDRLGTAAYNTVYGGKDSYTGPTLAGCSVASSTKLLIQFNATLLGGDSLKLNPAKPVSKSPSWYINKTEQSSHDSLTGGTLLYVQTNASNFCTEPMLMPGDYNSSTGAADSDYSYCPTWAGGKGQFFSFFSFQQCDTSPSPAVKSTPERTLVGCTVSPQ